jgi:hypothetical protein
LVFKPAVFVSTFSSAFFLLKIASALELLELAIELSNSFFFRFFLTSPLSGGGTLNLNNDSFISSSVSIAASGGSISSPLSFKILFK